MAKSRKKATQVKKNGKDSDITNIGSGLPEIPKVTPSAPKAGQAKVNRAFVHETTHETGYLHIDDIDEAIGHLTSISSSGSLDIFIDGINQNRRHDRSIPNNHLVKRNPYEFFWAKKADMVGGKVKGYTRVTRSLWKRIVEVYKASVLSDHAPDEDYIQHKDLILCVANHEQITALRQRQIIGTNIAAKKQTAQRAENSKRVAMQVEETGDMDYAEEAYSNDKSEATAMAAQVEHVKQCFSEDIGTIMKRLESGKALTPEEMARAVDETSNATEIIERTYKS